MKVKGGFRMTPNIVRQNVISFMLAVVAILLLPARSAISSDARMSENAMDPAQEFHPYVFDYRGDIESVPGEITAEFASSKYEVRKSEYKTLDIKQSGSVVHMEGFSLTTSPGDPALPVRIYEIAVPPNIDWKTLKLSVEGAEATLVPDHFEIIPAPPMRARVDDKDYINWGFDKDIVNGRNLKTYGKDQFFPGQSVRIIAQSQLRKWKFVKVEFSPVQYNPVKKQLRIVQSAKVRLNFSRIGKQAYRSDPILKDKFHDEEAKSRFINFDSAQEWYGYVPAPTPPKNLEPDPDYVIITTNAIQNNSTKLLDFVNHKTALGFQVRVVTENDYGTLTGQAPNGTAEKIRQWLMNNYVPLGIHYVLLIGNPDPATGDVPMKMCWPNRTSYVWQESPTDYFYADLTGNWDLDGDGVFGEDTSSTNTTSPGPGVASDNFSVRWTGRIQADANGNHIFVLASTQGVRLNLDGTYIINNWTSHQLATDYGSIMLTPGQHTIQLEYYNTTGDAIVSMYWQPTGSGNVALVPSDHLFHSVAGSYVAGGLDGEYFNSTNFTNSALTRVDSNIGFYWGAGDRGPGGVDFEPEVYVGRIPVYNNDYATLDSILQKTIDYETGPAPSWRNSFMNADVILWNNQSDYQIGETLKNNLADPLGFSTYRVYESNVSVTPAPECNAINAISTSPTASCNMLGEWANGDGYGLVTWSTHGWQEGAAALVTSTNATSLNDSSPAFVFQGSCENGWPEDATNLGYSLLKHGAIGTVSASRVSWNSIFTPPYDPNPLWGTNGELTYHFAMRIMKDQPAGHALYLTKANVAPDDLWMNKMDYNLYGDPSASLFRSIGGVVMLFDTSGSMSWSPDGNMSVPTAQQRLFLAKEAAYPFMTLLNEHAKTRTNFGISVFPPHPWNPSVGCNGQTETPMAQVNDANTNTAVNSTIPGLVAEDNTPLLAGLSTAAGMFGNEKPRAIVLLSDGYHNCPTIVDSNGPEVTALINNLKTTDTRVYTIGFGTPADVDHPLLTRLANDTGGQFYDVTTPSFDPATWSPATELQATYKAVLVDALGLETAADPTGVLTAGQKEKREVHISEYDSAVSFFLSWVTPQRDRLSMAVKTSDGISVPFTGTTPGVSVMKGNTYTILSLDRSFLRQAGKIGPAEWIIEIGFSEITQGQNEHYQYSVILDSVLKMEPSFEQLTYFVGDPILLTARITTGDMPVLGLTNVSARTTMPEDGLGNWFAKNKVSAEELRMVPGTRGNEVLSPAARKAYYLAENRKVAFPGITKPVSIRLYDDGTHGDTVANDGIYSAIVDKTPKEGTYSFEFHATGPAGKGSFERDKVVQKRLEIRPSMKNTLFEATRVPIDNPKLRRYRIVITPKDALGNYLGPGRAKEIYIRKTMGKTVENIKDSLDGSYSTMIDLPAQADIKQMFVTGEIRKVKFSFNLASGLK
jgi:hypothetical protein